jgi:hypothetical protein
MMIGYDIYDCFTIGHFRLRQRMTFTTKIYYSRLYKHKIHSRCFDIMGGHENFAFSLVVKVSAELGYVFLSNNSEQYSNMLCSF